VVEDVDPAPVDPPPVDVGAPVVEVVVEGDEQAARLSTPTAAAMTKPGRVPRRGGRDELDRPVRRGAAVLRS
jgi:hypothetical protein